VKSKERKKSEIKMEKRARPVKRPTSLDVKGIDKKIQKRPDSKKKRRMLVTL